MDTRPFLVHKPEVQPFFDFYTHTVSYVVADPSTATCAIIDSVLDYRIEDNSLSYTSADKIVSYIKKKKYTVAWILETHVHADHITAAKYLQDHFGGKIAISKHITEVQRLFAPEFEFSNDFPCDGSQFDHLFEDTEVFSIGSIPACAFHVPGHTPADIAYAIGDALFVGDTLFMHDYGTARCDFPGGDAEKLFNSIQKVYALPDTMRMFLCHDYLPPGRTTYCFETTIEIQKESNIHVKADTEPSQFITMRREKDTTLSLPKLIIPSIQINIQAGAIPKDAQTGEIRLKEALGNILNAQML